jgi:methionyl aminopeptidase
MIVRKTAEELQKMRRSGLLVYEILQKIGEMAVEGVCTYDLEVAAEKMIADAGAKPAFKGYYVPAAGEKYKFVLCTSVNEEIVHGMPSKSRILKNGDIVSIDTGVSLGGYFGDSALTVGVGEISAQAKKLMEVTRESLELAIDKVMVSRSSKSMSAMESAPSCMRSRKFPITSTGRMKTPACGKVWCLRSSPW